MAINSNPQTASGRIQTNPPLSADPLRYQFLSLQNAEPNLYLPAKQVNANNSLFTLLSDPLTGGRFWSNNSFMVDRYSNYVGFGTTQPNNRVSVVGNISATGYIYGTIITPTTAIPLAAGANTTVQYNSNNVLSGDLGFTYNQTASSIIVGQGNISTGQQTSILGGNSNTASGNQGFIGGGSGNNNIGSSGGAIVAGRENSMQGDYAFIGGGRANCANDSFAVVAGGYQNNNAGLASSIVGGQNNTIDTGVINAGILGGYNNFIQHDGSFIIGNNLVTTTANYTYFNHIEVDGQSILKGSVGEKVNTIAPILSSVTIDLLSATTFNLNLSSSVTTFSITHALANLGNSFTLYVNQLSAGNQTVNWSFNGNLVKWANRGDPVVTLSANATDVYTFVSINGGNTWYGFVAGQNFG